MCHLSRLFNDIQVKARQRRRLNVKRKHLKLILHGLICVVISLRPWLPTLGCDSWTKSNRTRSVCDSPVTPYTTFLFRHQTKCRSNLLSILHFLHFLHFIKSLIQKFICPFSHPRLIHNTTMRAVNKPHNATQHSTFQLSDHRSNN